MINLMELRGTYTTGGGPDKTILLSAEKHDKTIVNPIVVYLRDIRDHDFKIGEMAKGRGFEYIEVLDRAKVDLKCIIELNRLVRKKRIDIIHGHDYKTDILAWILRRMNPHVKIISTAHGWITNNFKAKAIKLLHLLFLTRFDRNLAVSNATKTILRTHGVSNKKIEVIYNAIDVDYWGRLKNKNPFREEFNIADRSFVIGSVGRIGPEKDYFTWLKVAKVIKERFPYTYFVIVGDGKMDELAELKAFALSIGLRNQVFFCGYRSDLLNIYSAFDLFFSTSLTEGLPNTVLEAMAMGVPVVATDVGGVNELVIDGKTGFLTKVRDTIQTSAFIDNIVAKEDLRQRLALNSRKIIEKNFSFENRLNKIESIYQELLTLK